MILLRQQTVIVGVGADPVPDHLVAFPESEGAIAQGDSHGIDRSNRMNLLESQTGMRWILSVWRELGKGLAKPGGRSGGQNFSGSSPSVRPPMLFQSFICELGEAVGRVSEAPIPFQ